jgi:hypothetical protein
MTTVYSWQLQMRIAVLNAPPNSSPFAAGKIEFKEYSPSTIFKVIKIFLSALPTPLLTYELHELFLGAAQNCWDSKDEQIQFLKSLISALPDPNRDILAEVSSLGNTLLHSAVLQDNKDVFFRELGVACMLRHGIHETNHGTEEDVTRLMIIFAQYYETLFPLSVKTVVNKPPAWLTRINMKKLAMVTMVLEKLENFIEYVAKYPGLAKDMKPEFDVNLRAMESKLLGTKQALDPLKSLKLVESYHLERAYVYFSNLNEAVTQAGLSNQLNRYFRCIHLYGSLEKLLLLAHHELDLFCAMTDYLLGGSVRSSQGLNAIHQYCLELIQDPDGRDLWKNSFGWSTWMVNWSTFIDVYMKAIGITQPPPAVEDSLRSVLDYLNSGFVTVYKFAEFLKAFGSLKQSMQKVKDILSQPWFHGFLTNDEAERLLEPCDAGTFLVRFSHSTPGSFAVNVKAQQNISIKIETTKEGFAVKEDENYRVFPSISKIVLNYSSFLRTPYTEKLAHEPWFFGDLTSDESRYFLADEPIGTFLVRFSSQPCNLTISIVDKGFIQHQRIERRANGRIFFPSNQREYDNIQQFVATQIQEMRLIPFGTDAAAAGVRKDDEEKRRRYTINPDILLKEELQEEGAVPEDLKEHLTPYSATEEELLPILIKGCQKEYQPTEHRLLLNALLKLTPEDNEKLQRKAHRQARLDNNKKFDKHIPKLVKFSSYFLQKKGASMNELHLITFQISKKIRTPVKFTIKNPVSITRRHFFSITPTEGMLDKNDITIKVAVVLFQPVVFRYLIDFAFVVKLGATKSGQKVEEYTEYYSIPIRVVVNKQNILREVEPKDYWRIQRNEIEIQNKIGGGSSAAVFRAKLYGAEVAIKNWDIGKKDPPPKDFKSELDILSTLKHNNLLLFLGACDETGTAFLVTEFAKYGSLDRFLENSQKENRIIPMGEKIRLGMDVARGMQFLHEHHIIHRDLKSMNLLVDGNLNVKVADFGESRNVAHTNLTVATGTYDWMAPEVVSSSHYSAQADVFSFGIILWELLTNLSPQRSLSEVEEGKVPPIDPNLQTLYPEYIDLLRMCCRKNPHKRPSFATILHKLKQCRVLYAPMK